MKRLTVAAVLPQQLVTGYTVDLDASAKVDFIGVWAAWHELEHRGHRHAGEATPGCTTLAGALVCYGMLVESDKYFIVKLS